MANNEKRSLRILSAICIIPLIVGIILLCYSKTEVEYPCSEYWVAKDFHHVYEKYNGQIVDYISENEKCEIKNDVIVVTTTKRGLYNWGSILTIFFGMATGGLIISLIGNTEWWQDLMDRLTRRKY